MKMEQNEKLTTEEKKLLKDEIHEAWDELPSEIQDLIMEVKHQKLKVLYMLQDWSKNHDHETMLDLLSRKISHMEEKLKKMGNKSETNESEEQESGSSGQSYESDETHKSDHLSDEHTADETDSINESGHTSHKGE